MHYADRALEFLERQAAWRYSPRSAPAAEPTAFAALALAAHNRPAAALRACAWLRDAQGPTGAVGIRIDQPEPGWPTPLAILAWTCATHGPAAAGQPNEHAAASAAGESLHASYAASRARAVDWLLALEGKTSPQDASTGHDTMLVGWPWVAGTHSWVEPTAAALLALRAVGRGEHPRAREARRLLEDRLLAAGGCNYGNTVVLGQALLPHVEPTGATLLALAGYPDVMGRKARAVEYLQATLGPHTTPASLAYGLLGLAACGHVPPHADAWLAARTVEALRREAALELALLALAALGELCPLIQISQVRTTA